ncbi:2-alkenal reductase (NADP(+)-dependent) isoform X1 [Eucalyptus grandis]|uniref:2-alkenal reductase (NADP(+)-dependent) isoform X1 n=1 Tax=Eucalyptus grandis TaxID=71139 RepID=UPI00192E92DE|nr:2-alkenal reductase (NADP(+)-dependent) isoform X1 [Eucalyptus grandis]
MEVANKHVTLKTHIEGAPKESDFELKTSPLALSLDPGSGEMIVKNLYVSIDPHQLNQMKSCSLLQKTSTGFDGIALGEEIEAYGVAKVVASDNVDFEKGDVVMGVVTWAEYSKIRRNGMIRKLDPLGFPLSYHLGILGYSGLTAYAGFFEICKPKRGEKVFVSTAAGSVGNLVGQYAKLHGCYVVGCAGSKRKVQLLKEKLGFDEAFNYKEETDLNSTLKRYFPDGIDIYFDNVGAEMQEAAVANMNTFGRVAVSGVISEYADPGKRAAPNMLQVIFKRIKIHGFLAADHVGLFQDFISTTSHHLRNGELCPLEDISDSLDSIPFAFTGLFRGDNIGKKIVKIA